MSSMKITSWNVRGLSASEKGIELRNKLILLRQISTLFKRLKICSDIYAETIKKWSASKSLHMQGTGALVGPLTLWNPKTVCGILIG